MEAHYGISAEGMDLSVGEAPAYEVGTATHKAALTAEHDACAVSSKHPKGGVTSQFIPYAAPVAAARELHMVGR
jgi:hypothetical protein